MAIGMSERLRRAGVVTTLFAVAALLADGLGLARSGAPLGTCLLVFGASAAWALGLGTAFALLIAGLESLGAPLAARRRAGAVVAGGLFVLPAAAVLWLVLDDLLDGPGISRLHRIGAIRLGAGLVAVGGPMVLAWGATRLWAKAARSLRPLRTTVVALAVAGGSTALILLVDARVQPQRYPSFHLALWFAVLVLAGMTEVFCRRGPAARLELRPVALLGLIGLAAACLGWPLDRVPGARPLAFRSTLFLKQVVANVAPKPVADFAPVDAELLGRLRAAPTLDARALDDAFPGRRRFNVLLLSIDAVRYDRSRTTPPAREVLPNFNRLFARSVFFENAWTTYPATSQAFASLFSGLYPSATDVVQALRSTGERLEVRSQPVMAELLRASGRSTEAVTSFSRGMMSTWFPHIALGFDRFNAHAGSYRPLETPEAPKIAAHALDALDRLGEQTFFLWVHALDPHEPYRPTGAPVFGSKPVDLYDAEILYTDREFGRIVDALEQRGRLKDTVIIALSDHGEEFGEKGRFFHASSVCAAQVHVPMSIYVPGVAPKSVRRPVDFTDLLPTVLDLLGLDAVPGLHGQSLARLILEGDPADADDPRFPPPVAFAELSEPELIVGSRQEAYLRGSMKLVVDLDAGTKELYDLDADPREATDLAAARALETERLRSGLAALEALIQETKSRLPEPSDMVATLGKGLQSLNDDSNIYALRRADDAHLVDRLEEKIVELARPRRPSVVRRAAVLALGDGASAATREILVTLLRDEDESVGRAAAIALARRGGREGVDSALFAKVGDAAVRRDETIARAFLGEAPAVLALRKLLAAGIGLSEYETALARKAADAR